MKTLAIVFVLVVTSVVPAAAHPGSHHCHIDNRCH